ncbi:hypothetical protein LP417_32260 [Polaromonas sp. P1-6]|nr:hypothetical protein LP417_32260 [Polaromonas sp. P1-6]
MKFIIVFFAALATSMTAAAYDPIEYRNSQLRSVFNVRMAAISVFINTTFFDPMKPGESLERKLRSSPLGGGDEIDKSLEYNGRVLRTIETLLSSKLEKSLSIRTVDWKVAPFQIAVNVRINQMLDLYGKDMFQIRFSLDLQELATARSGFNGFCKREAI